MQDEVEVGDVFREVYNALNEDGFYLDVHQPTRQMRSSWAIHHEAAHEKRQTTTNGIESRYGEPG